MKQGIHPEYVECTVKCTCGNVFTTRSTKSELKIDICNKCHPFFTGTQKLIDTGGRVQRFADKFGSAKEQVAAREAAKKAERAAKAAEIEAAKKAEREAKAAAKAKRAEEFAKKAAAEAEKAAEIEAATAAAEAVEAPAEAEVEAAAETAAEEHHSTKHKKHCIKSNRKARESGSSCISVALHVCSMSVTLCCCAAIRVLSGV